MNSSASQLAKQNRSLRRPSAPLEDPQRPRQLHQRRGSARRIDAPVDPRVAMIADDDHVVRPLAAADHARDGPDRPDAIVGADSQARNRRSGPGTIGERQRTAPGWRHFRTVQRLENDARVLVRQGRADDPRERHGVRRRDPAGVRQRRPSGRQRVAGHEEVVHDAAALDVALGPPRTLRVHLAFHVPVVRGIGIDQDSCGAALLSGQRLESTVAVGHRVAHQRDLAAHVNPARREPVVLGRVAAAGVDDRRGDVARGRVGVVRKTGFLDADLRVRITRNRVLAHRRAPCFRRRQLHGHFFGPRQEHFVGGDRDLVESEVPKAVARPLGQLAIAIGAREVRLCREETMRVENPRCRGQLQKIPFQREVRGGASLEESEGRARRLPPGSRQQRDRDHRQRRTDARGHRRSLTISLDAFCPDPPVTPPPGCVPEPHM